LVRLLEQRHPFELVVPERVDDIADGESSPT
jgi:hypothetical protein